MRGKATELITKINKNIPEIDLTLGLKESQGLKDLIQASELIEKDEETDQKFLKLAQSCKWVGMAPELTYLLSDKSQAAKPTEPYILGVTGLADAMGTLIIHTRGKDFWQAHTDVNQNPWEMGHTEKFMEKITASGKDILFVVPPNIFSFNPGKVTREEIVWLLNNPDKAKNVYLIFGAYDLVNKNWLQSSQQTMRESHRQLKLSEAFSKWIEEITRF